MDVDDTSRVLDDLEVICYSNLHKFFSFAVALPSIIVWGVGIPLFALLLLFRDRNNLEEISVKKKFGFFFRGYKSSFYFWEIVIMYKKVAVIIISVFVSTVGVIAQALIVFAILIL